MIDHDHDENGNCLPPSNEGLYQTTLYQTTLPSWRFSLWDIVGIGFSYVGALGGVWHQACNMVARECQAAANNRRQTLDLREAQRLNEAARKQMSASLQRLTGLGGDS